MLLDTFQHCPACGSSHFAVNDERSKHCLQCGFTYYINASGAYAALIVNTRGEILVVRRAKDPAKGTLDLPGGFADPGETAEQGVAREVMEETGMRVTSARYLFSMPNSYIYSGMPIPTLDLFFLCQVEETDSPHASDDAAQAMWMPIESINPDDFGLNSIRLAMQRLKADRHRLMT